MNEITTPIPLQGWFEAQGFYEDKKDFFFYNAASKQIIFVRDRLIQPLYGTYAERDSNPPVVISTHHSKSMTLPVYQFRLAGVTITLRDNFHDWKISVQSDRPIVDNFGSLIKRGEDISSVYFEGFPKELCFPGFAPGAKEFSIELWDDYEVYTFCFLLMEARKAAGA